MEARFVIGVILEIFYGLFIMAVFSGTVGDNISLTCWFTG